MPRHDYTLFVIDPETKSGQYWTRWMGISACSAKSAIKYSVKLFPELIFTGLRQNAKVEIE